MRAAPPADYQSRISRTLHPSPTPRILPGLYGICSLFSMRLQRVLPQLCASQHLAHSLRPSHITSRCIAVAPTEPPRQIAFPSPSTSGFEQWCECVMRAGGSEVGGLRWGRKMGSGSPTRSTKPSADGRQQVAASEVEEEDEEGEEQEE